MKNLILILLFLITLMSCKQKSTIPWYSGKPYEQIVLEMVKPENHLIKSVSVDTCKEPIYSNGSKYYYFIRFEFIDNTWDTKKAYQIEQIISKNVTVTPSGSGSLLWKTPLYDMELWHNDAGYINFMIYEK